MANNTSYEIEIRFLAATAEEAFQLLPFLEASLGPEKTWATAIYGRAIYESGRLLRVGRVPAVDPVHYYLGYKGVDEGSFANVRREWGEEITTGAPASPILATIGIHEALATPEAVIERLAQAGHHPFMDFTGVDRLGYEPTLGLHTKLMRCPKILGDQVMVELEVAADSYNAACDAEQRLRTIAHEFHIVDRLVRDEPPTLLYQVTFLE